jgi:putative transposase
VRVDNCGTFFVTSQTWERRSLFQADELAQLFLRTLYSYAADRRFLLHDFVVMPNHIHLILTPVDGTLERDMQLIKGGFSHAVAKAGRPNLEIWQKGFSDHRIRDWRDYLHHRDYIHQNPVKARFCPRPEQFPYSSANPRYKVDAIPQRLKPTELAGGRHD